MESGAGLRLERFERAVVFRSARFLPLILSAISTLMLIIAVVVLLYSLIPSLRPNKPKPLPEPAQVSVNRTEISSYLNRTQQPATATQQQNQEDQGSETGQTSPPPEPTVSPEAKSIAAELNFLRDKAAALDLPWDNEFQTVCQQIFFGNCYGQRTVLTARGVYGYIGQAFSHHNDPETAEETVQINDQSYRVNPSHYDAKLAIVKELEAVLSSARPEDARKVLAAWGKLREEKENARDKSLADAREHQEQTYARAQADYENTVARKHVLRGASLSAAGFALGAFVLLGLILAVLAVERHTRLLEATLRQVAPVSAAEQSRVLTPAD